MPIRLEMRLMRLYVSVQVVSMEGCFPVTLKMCVSVCILA
jgi:hypothetical protein